MKIMCVFGTRPEAIKFAPVIHAIQREKGAKVIVCVTAQHRQMLDEVLRVFDIKTHIDMDIMQPKQQLDELTTRMLTGLSTAIKEACPDWVLVQGDTTTTFAAALAAFYNKVPVGHIEAGLRTNDKYAPYPEEINRRLTTVLADWHFAPTDCARKNLLIENVPDDRILMTGNTGVDAIHWMVTRIKENGELQNELRSRFDFLAEDCTAILVTAHRRENFGKPIENIFLALRDAAQQYPAVQIIFPVHPNPVVRSACDKIFGSNIPPNIHLIEPVDYPGMVYLLMHASLIVTDSGGLQEEAPFLGKPVLVLRNTTERPEAVDAGVARLVGTSRNMIFNAISDLLAGIAKGKNIVKQTNIFGDGMASERIVKALCSKNV